MMRKLLWLLVALSMLLLSACGDDSQYDAQQGAQSFVSMMSADTSSGIAEVSPMSTSTSTTVTPGMTMDWAEYAFAELFPTGDATHFPAIEYEGVTYNARLYSGDWGDRYLGITADGRIFGLGDFTNHALQQFQTIDHWADQVRANQVLLGPLAGAEIRAYRIADLNLVVEGPIIANNSRDNLATAGTFNLSLAGIPDDEWILVTATGGWDIDADDDGVIDATPTPNLGTIHALAQAADWRSGKQKMNVLTDIAWRYASDFISEIPSEQLDQDLKWISSGLLMDDINGDSELNYLDLTHYSPTDPLHRNQIKIDDQVLSGIINAIHRDSDNDIKELFDSAFGNSLKPLRPLVMREVVPVINIPAEQTTVNLQEITVRSFISERSEVADVPEGGSLIAEDADGRTLFLGYVFPAPKDPQPVAMGLGKEQPQLLAFTQTNQPEMSPRSTVLALIIMIAGNGLDADGITAIAEGAISHPDFQELVQNFHNAFVVNPFFLDALGNYPELVEPLKRISAELFEDYLAQLDSEPDLQMATMMATLNKRFYNPLSPWRSGQPWNWYGNANFIDVWNPPFPAVQTNNSRMLAMGNPGMVNLSVAIYDSNGRLLASPNNWRMVPRNSTMIQKAGVNSGAAYRGLDLPREATYLEFEKHRFTFSGNKPGSSAVSIFNSLHLVSSAVSLASVATSKLIKDVMDKAEASKKGWELAELCALYVSSTVDFYKVSNDNQDAATNGMLTWMHKNLASFTETAVTGCGVPLIRHFAGDAISQQIKNIAPKAATELTVKLSNPAGWAVVVATAANDFGPFALSYLSTRNNYAVYQLVRDTFGNITDVVRTDRKPEPAPTPRTVTATFGSGGNVSPPASRTVNDGATTTFTVTPNSGYQLGNVGGTCPSGSWYGNTYTTGAITGNCSVSFSFSVATPIAYPLSVSKSGSGSGTVSSNPSGISCGSNCTSSFNSDTSVLLTATPTSGSTFVGWGGVCSGASTTCSVTMNQARSVTATFNTQAVTKPRVNASVGTGGTVTPDVAIVNIGASATFTVTPNSGYQRGTAITSCPSGSWNGNTYTTGAITDNCAVGFTFSAVAPITHTVTANAQTGGTVTPGSRTVNNGATTSFTVTPSTGYQRGTAVTSCPSGSWNGNTYTTGAITGNCAVSFNFTEADYTHDKFRVTNGTYAHTANNDTACKSEFGSGYRLADWNDVVAYYNSGASMSAFFTNLGLPAPGATGARSLHVSRNGSEMYSSSRHYFITRHDHNKPGSYLAHANINNYLVSLGSWDGNRHTLCYENSTSLTTHTLSVSKSGTGSGTVTSSPSGISCGSNCISSFNSATSVTLTAAATSGSTFAGWSGACSGTSATCSVTMSQARNVTAIFNQFSSGGGDTHDKFRVTNSTYAHTANNDTACKSEFGSGYRLADWNDVVAYYNSGASMSAFFTNLGLPAPGATGERSLSVSRNGSEMYSSSRHYFISRHDHNLPSYYLAHANINNYLVSLGSWDGNRHVLCYEN